MSTSLTNKLNSVNTWQFNYVLLMSNSTDSLRQSIRTDDTSKLLQKIQTYRIGSRYLDNATNSTFIPVINTMINQEFSVDSCNLSTIIMDGMKPGVNTKITLNVLEPKGIYFTQLLKNATQILNINAKNVVYLLFVIAKGFNTEGEVIIDQTTPIILLNKNVDLTITAAGGKYVMEFIDVGTGAPDISYNIGTPIEFSTRNASTVGYALKSLETALNSLTSLTYNGCSSEGVQVKNTFYQITWPKEYDSFVLDRSIFDVSTGSVAQGMGMTDYQKQLANISTNDKSFAYPVGQNVISIINDILLSSSQITKRFNKLNNLNNQSPNQPMMTPANNTTNNSFYNFSGGTATTPVGGTENDGVVFTIHAGVTSDANSHTYHFDVIEYNTNQTDIDYELDYIHTGVNTEVIDLNLHMDGVDTFVFIQSPNNDNKVYSTDIPTENDPATPIKKSQVGTQTSVASEAQQAKLQYINSFAMFFGRTKASVDATIRGNFKFLQMIHSKILPHTTPLSNGIDNYTKIVQNQNQLFHTRPAVVQINVYSPNSSSNSWGDSYLVRENGKPLNMWFSGKYIILSIDSSFTGGKFTQVLHMIPLLLNNSTSVSESASKQTSTSNQIQVPTSSNTNTTTNESYNGTVKPASSVSEMKSQLPQTGQTSSSNMSKFYEPGTYNASAYNADNSNWEKNIPVTPGAVLIVGNN